MPIDPERPFGNAKLTHDCQNLLVAMFQGIANEKPPLEGDTLLQEIQDGKDSLAFVHAIGGNLNLYNETRDFLTLKGVTMVESEQAGRRIARRVIATIWPGDENAMEREKDMTRRVPSKRD